MRLRNVGTQGARYIYTPNSKKVALAIGHWALGHTEHNAMLCLSDCRGVLSVFCQMHDALGSRFRLRFRMLQLKTPVFCSL